MPKGPRLLSRGIALHAENINGESPYKYLYEMSPDRLRESFERGISANVPGATPDPDALMSLHKSLSMGEDPPGIWGPDVDRFRIAAMAQRLDRVYESSFSAPPSPAEGARYFGLYKNNDLQNLWSVHSNVVAPDAAPANNQAEVTVSLHDMIRREVEGSAHVDSSTPLTRQFGGFGETPSV